MIPFHTVPKVGSAQTVNLTTSTVVSYDLASASEALGAMDDKQVCAIALLLGRSASNFVRFQRLCSFSRVAGVAAQLDGSPVVLGTDFLSAALAGSVPTLDVSGTTIRVRGTGVAANTITWTGYLWLFTAG